MAGLRNFFSWRKGLTSPGDVHEDVPNGTVKAYTAKTVPRAVYANSTGTAVLTDSEGTIITYNVVIGQILPFRPYGISNTSTADLVTMW